MSEPNEDIIDKDSICTDGKPHTPEWCYVTVEHGGGKTYIDVPCSKCGRSGCIGTSATLEKDISW